MILAVDIGNSFLKWKLFDKEKKVNTIGRCALVDVEAEMLKLKARPIKSLAYSSVANKDVASCIKQGLSKDVTYIEISAGMTTYGVKNGYDFPDSLGADRWIVMVESFMQANQTAICVIDAGTAITLDVVDDQGQHKGGFIVPSAHLMINSLENSTSKVRTSGKSCPAGYGTSTNCAVSNGIDRLLSAWLQSEIDLFKADYPHGTIFFTGGAVSTLIQKIQCDNKVYSKDLLLDGLLRLAENQTNIRCE